MRWDGTNSLEVFYDILNVLRRKYIHIMNGLGIVMILIYMHVYFAPFRRLKEAVLIQNWQEGGKRLNQIRKMVGINLSLGLIVVIVASGGRYLGV